MQRSRTFRHKNGMKEKIIELETNSKHKNVRLILRHK
jgi:hypothetical protein